ncbi:MAG TPA: hypothetical protein PLU72_15275 [Candidatus Ozemobacteraceae bacterium]|nr:hypothetical protein [Candidatus Ozemobacteraceae bacterium]
MSRQKAPRFLKYLAFSFFLAGLLWALPLAAQAQLSNGQEPVVSKAYRVTVMGSRQVSNADERSLKKLIGHLNDAVKKVTGWGIPMDRAVRIMLYTDTHFPSRDVWTAAGVTPDQKGLAAFVEENTLLFATMSGYEMAHEADRVGDKWFFLRPVKLKKEYLSSPQKLTSKDLTHLENLVKAQGERLGKSFTQSLADNMNDYVVFDSAAYSFPIGTLWVPVRKADDLHRFLDTIVHEFGHHVFYQLVTHVLHRTNPKNRWTRTQIFTATRNLLALNEFFADYTAVSCGHNVVISVHNLIAGIPKDFKRYFSQDRTLAEYLAAANGGTKLEQEVLREGHNALNPCRSFAWKLKLALGTAATDKLVVAAVRDQVLEYFGKELPRLKRTPSKLGWGCYEYSGYPTDVLTENLRFLGHLQAAADKQLSAAQKAQFAAEAEKIFGAHYPLKPAAASAQ